LRISLTRFGRTLLLLAVANLSEVALAQYKGLDPTLDKAVKEYDQAQIKGDRAALQRLVADDYLLMRANGTVVDKAALIELVAPEGGKNNPFAVEKPFSRNYGDVVILGGWVHLTGTDHGKPYAQNARFADTWARRKGRWYVVFTAVALADKP
jgi:ketosteroid isomerase-like protein